MAAGKNAGREELLIESGRSTVNWWKAWTTASSWEIVRVGKQILGHPISLADDVPVTNSLISTLASPIGVSMYTRTAS